MTRKKDRPKVVYANSINLSGLYSQKPLKCKLTKYDDEDDDSKWPTTAWWDKEGNFDVRILGLDVQAGIITFASESKEEVRLWTEGVISAMAMLRIWSGTG